MHASQEDVLRNELNLHKEARFYSSCVWLAWYAQGGGDVVHRKVETRKEKKKDMAPGQ